MWKVNKTQKNNKVKKNDSKYEVISDVKLILWALILEQWKSLTVDEKSIVLIKNTSTYKKWLVKISKL